MERIRAIIKEVGKGCRELYVDNTLKELQKLVDGYIECVSIAPGVLLICNEEGYIAGKDYNCIVKAPEDGYEFVLYGDILFVGRDGAEFADLPHGTTTKEVAAWIKECESR